MLSSGGLCRTRRYLGTSFLFTTAKARKYEVQYLLFSIIHQPRVRTPEWKLSLFHYSLFPPSKIVCSHVIKSIAMPNSPKRNFKHNLPPSLGFVLSRILTSLLTHISKFIWPTLLYRRPEWASRGRLIQGLRQSVRMMSWGFFCQNFSILKSESPSFIGTVCLELKLCFVGSVFWAFLSTSIPKVGIKESSIEWQLNPLKSENKPSPSLLNVKLVFSEVDIQLWPSFMVQLPWLVNLIAVVWQIPRTWLGGFNWLPLRKVCQVEERVISTVLAEPGQARKFQWSSLWHENT